MNENYSDFKPLSIYLRFTVFSFCLLLVLEALFNLKQLK